MSRTSQLALPVEHRCHWAACSDPTVGSSIAKEDGHVCRRHNEMEWGTALVRNGDSYWGRIGLEMKRNALAERGTRP